MKTLLNFLIDNPDVRYIMQNNVVRIMKIDNAKALQVQSIIEKEKLFLSLNGMITPINIYKLQPKAIAPVVSKKK